MTTKDLARNYQLDQGLLEAIILKNEMPHRNCIGYITIDDESVDFLLELYYKDKDKNSGTSISAHKDSKPDGVVYHIDGARGRKIDIYPNKCVITVDVTLGSVMTSNATDGEKTIYYSDCIGLQCKKPGITIGYLQFETAASISNNMASNFFNENTFTYESTNIDENGMSIVEDYVKQQLEKIKRIQATPAYSIADELKKFKDLLDSGVITEDEFTKWKAKLLDS